MHKTDGCFESLLTKKQCDELRPRCGRCVTKDLCCTYKHILQFREDLEGQGKTFGREGVWSKKKNNDKVIDLIEKSKETHYQILRNKDLVQFINFEIYDFEDRIYPSLQLSIIPHDIRIQDNYDHSSLNFALNYYIELIAPIFNPITKIRNLHVVNSKGENIEVNIGKGLNFELLIQYSQIHNHIFYLILSLGAKYLTKINNDMIWEEESLVFHKLGLKLILKNIIAIQMGGNDPILDTNIMISLMLLIMYEIANDCNKNWSNYLNICRRINNSKNFIKPQVGIEIELLRFCLEFLQYQESMGRTVCKATNSFFIPVTEERSDLIKSVSWTGCERDFIDVVSDITDLSFERSNPKISGAFQSLFQDIFDKLETMKLGIDIDNSLIQKGGSQIFDSELILLDKTQDLELFCFVLLSEIKIITLQIYLQCSLSNVGADDTIIRDQVHKICEIMKFIVLKNDFKWCSTLLWSIFVIAVTISNIDDESDHLRYLIFQLFDKVRGSSLGNVDSAKELVMRVWRKRDLELGSSSTNDWERYVFDGKINISLA